MKKPNSLKVAAAVLSVCLLHALLYFFHWELGIGVPGKILIATFWVSVIAVLALFYWLNKNPRIVIGTVVLGVIAVLPTAETSLALTLWSINGFAP